MRKAFGWLFAAYVPFALTGYPSALECGRNLGTCVPAVLVTACVVVGIVCSLALLKGGAR